MISNSSNANRVLQVHAGQAIDTLLDRCAAKACIADLVTILGEKELNVLTELFKDKKTGTLNSQVLDISLKTIPHVSCPVISGVLKTLEVSVGLTLPKDSTIVIKYEQPNAP